MARSETELGQRLLLGLDSCGAETSLALGRIVDSELMVTAEKILAARTAGTQITSALAEVLGNGSGDGPLVDLSAMVVVTGPGSFTGMRIGLSAAKALAVGAGVPLVGVSRLEVLARMAGNASAVALDAGRGGVYLRWPQVDELEGNKEGLGEERAGQEKAGEEALTSGIPVQEVLLNAEEARKLNWAGIVVCEERLATRFPPARRIAVPTAVDALRCGIKRVIERDWDDAEMLDAHYLWRPEQMLRLPAGR